MNVLTKIQMKENESAEQTRRRAYRRLFGILWVSNSINNFPQTLLGLLISVQDESQISDAREYSAEPCTHRII